MEKHSHVFERFATFDNLYNGYLLARRDKRKKGEVLEYSARLEDNIFRDLGRLQNKTYCPGHPHPFYEYFPKKRLIHWEKILNDFVLVRNMEQYRETIGNESTGKQLEDFAPVDGYGSCEPVCWDSRAAYYGW